MNSKDLSLTLRNEWNLGMINPINIQQSCLEHLKNLTIVWMDLNNEIYGSCSKTKTDYLIYLNSNHTKGQQNLTLAHELYHILYENNENWIICSEDKNDKSEIKANEFASQLLLPDIALDEFEKRNHIQHWTIEDMIKCEQYFQISHECLLNRLNNNDNKFNSEKNIIEKAIELGFETSLYEPTGKEFSLGAYISLTEKIYKNTNMTNGKREEFLLHLSRSDIVYNLKED